MTVPGRQRLRTLAAGVLVFAVAFATALSGAYADKDTDPDDSEICVRAAAAMEPVYGIPRRLLRAIALAESGRWDRARKQGFPWPWTLRAGDAGRFFDTKNAAVAELRRLRRRGVRNIDVGCMQINMLHHPKAFQSPDDALDPMRNAEYAAMFLRRLRDRTRSWSRAVALYHSGVKSRGLGYWRRVSAIWRDERRDNHRAPRNGLRALFQRDNAERAARLGYTATVGPLGAPIVRIP